LVVIEVFKNSQNAKTLSAILDQGTRWQIVAESVFKDQTAEVKKQIEDIALQMIQKGLKFLEILASTMHCHLTWGEFQVHAKKEKIDDIEKVTINPLDKRMRELLLEEKREVARVISIDERWKDLATNSFKDAFLYRHITNIENAQKKKYKPTDDMISLMRRLQLMVTMKEFAEICWDCGDKEAAAIIKEIAVEEVKKAIK